MSRSGVYAVVQADGVWRIVRSDGESAPITDMAPRMWGTRFLVSDRGDVLVMSGHDLQTFGSDGRKRFTWARAFDEVVPGPADVFLATRDGGVMAVRYEDGEITRLDLSGKPYFIGFDPVSQEGSRVHLSGRTIELVTADGYELPQPSASGWVEQRGFPGAWDADGWPLHDLSAGRIALHRDLLLACEGRHLLLRNWRTQDVLWRGRLAEPADAVVVHGEHVVALMGGRIAIGGIDGRWRETPQVRAKDALFDPDGVLVSLHADGLRRWRSLGDTVPPVTPLPVKGPSRVAADRDGFAILAGSSVHCFTADGRQSWQAPAKFRGALLGLSADRVAVLRDHRLCLLNRADGEQVACIDVHATACATDGTRWAVASHTGVQIVDRNGLRERWLQGVSFPRSLAWDGDVLAIAGEEDTLLFDMRLVDAMGGHPVDEWIVPLK